MSFRFVTLMVTAALETAVTLGAITLVCVFLWIMIVFPAEALAQIARSSSV